MHSPPDRISRDHALLKRLPYALIHHPDYMRSRHEPVGTRIRMYLQADQRWFIPVPTSQRLLVLTSIYSVRAVPLRVGISVVQVRLCHSEGPGEVIASGMYRRFI